MPQRKGVEPYSFVWKVSVTFKTKSIGTSCLRDPPNTGVRYIVQFQRWYDNEASANLAAGQFGIMGLENQTTVEKVKWFNKRSFFLPILNGAMGKETVSGLSISS